MNAEEPMGQDAALKIGPELPLHEPGDRPLLVPGVGEEGLEVLPHRLVQHGLFRSSGAIFG
jgi:hypothetical protein